jgi:putative sterol carrier protein
MPALTAGHGRLDNHVSKDARGGYMPYPFPSLVWLEELYRVLNHDERYAMVAQKWEGDMIVNIEPDPGEPNDELPVGLYLDLWHGACRSVQMYQHDLENLPSAAFRLRAPISNITKIFTGELDPVQAMLTRRLNVQGNMAYILRNIPVVLDFVRCCRLVEIEGLNPPQ